MITSLSPLLMSSLFNIGEVARKHNITLHLLLTPKHERFLEGIPVPFQNEYDLFIDDFLRLYPEVTYLDLSALDEFTEDLFHDYDHLNSKGARLLTKYLHNNFF